LEEKLCTLCEEEHPEDDRHEEPADFNFENQNPTFMNPAAEPFADPSTVGLNFENQNPAFLNPDAEPFTKDSGSDHSHELSVIDDLQNADDEIAFLEEQLAQEMSYM